MDNTALIFGATGQDGSYLSELLLSKGYKVYGTTRQVSVPNKQRLTQSMCNPNYEIVMSDITDGASVSRLIKKLQPKEIYNLAAQSHVSISFDEPGHTWDVTAKGCLNILEAIRSESPKSKFFQASSSEMYGGNFNIVTYVADGGMEVETYRYQNEGTPFLPKSPYAIAKVAAHNFTKVYRETYGLFACSGIMFNHESPRRGEIFVTRKITKYIGDLLRSVDKFPKLKLGNLDVYRDWGHAKDYVLAMWMMLNADMPKDYVISTGKSHSLKEFLQLAFDSAGFYWKNQVEIDPKLFRPNEVPFCCGESDLIKKDLGWSPKISFKEMVREMVNEDSKIHRSQT